MDPDAPSTVPRETEDSHSESPAGAHGALRRPALDEHGMERPVFLLDFPQDPALERLIQAFEVGNYALVRRDAERLAAVTEDLAVRAAALELRRRIEPDPLAKYLLFISFVLLVFLVVWAYKVQAR